MEKVPVFFEKDIMPFFTVYVTTNAWAKWMASMTLGST